MWQFVNVTIQSMWYFAKGRSRERSLYGRLEELLAKLTVSMGDELTEFWRARGLTDSEVE